MTTVIRGTDDSASTPALTGTDTDTGVFFPAANTMAMSTGGTEAMRVTSAQRVGIGTTAPATKLHVENNSTTVPAGFSLVGGSADTSTVGLDGGAAIVLRNLNTGNNTYNLIIGQDAGGNSTSGIVFQNNSDANNEGTLAFLTRPSSGSMTERARISSIGDFRLGTTSQIGAGWLSMSYNGGDYNGLTIQSTTSGTYYAALFYPSTGNFVGSISVAASSTAYNTSSDYRLKENIAPMTNGLAKILQLNPVTYTWKVDGSAGEGFIAHELQEVCPQAVTGEKDAVNEDGSIKSQGVDTSFLVATMTAAIQELKAINDAQASRIETLEAKVAALEAK